MAAVQRVVLASSWWCRRCMPASWATAVAFVLLVLSGSGGDVLPWESYSSSRVIPPPEAHWAWMSDKVLSLRDRRFELPSTKGTITAYVDNPVRVIGICGNVRHDSWMGSRWPALVVLANMAMEGNWFSHVAPWEHPEKHSTFRWKLGIGNNPREEIDEAFRLLTNERVSALVGCGSDETAEAIAAVATATHIPMIPTNAFSVQLFESDQFPYYFRIVPSEAATAQGFYMICVHWEWRRVGFIYDHRPMWVELDKTRWLNEDMTNSEYSTDFVGFQVSLAPHIQTITKMRDSGLRVFGVTGRRLQNVTQFLEHCLDFNFGSPLFVLMHTEVWAGIRNRMATNGWFVIGSVDMSCCTPLAKSLEDIWQSLSWKTLEEHGVPLAVLEQMTLASPNLFKESPWLNRGAFFVDAIIAVLLAFQKIDHNKSAESGDESRSRKIIDTLHSLQFEGVSGWLNLTTAQKKHETEDWRRALLSLNQVRNATLKPIGVLLPQVKLSASVVFPNGQGDPREYNARPTLHIGLCGNTRGEKLGWNVLAWPATIAFALRTIGTPQAVLPELHKLPFKVKWHLGFSNNWSGELAEGMRLLEGNQAEEIEPVHALIGCTSDRVTMHLAALSSVRSTVLVSPFAAVGQLSNSAEFPYFFRTVPASGDQAESFVAVTRFFGWREFGVVSDDTPEGQSFADAVELVCAATEMRFEFFKLHPGAAAAQVLQRSALQVSWQMDTQRLMQSPLRVFGVAVAVRMFPDLIRAILAAELHKRIFIVSNFACGFRLLEPYQQRNLDGMIGIDHPQQGNTQAALNMRSTWQKMDQLSTLLLDRGELKGKMQEIMEFSDADPFQANSALALDAIMVVLLAAKHSMSRLDHGRFVRRNFIEAVRSTSFEGASGHMSFAAGGTSGDRGGLEIRFHQAQGGKIVHLGQIRLVQEGSVRRLLELWQPQQMTYPDGSTNPRHFDRAGAPKHGGSGSETASKVHAPPSAAEIQQQHEASLKTLCVMVILGGIISLWLVRRQIQMWCTRLGYTRVRKWHGSQPLPQEEPPSDEELLSNGGSTTQMPM